MGLKKQFNIQRKPQNSKMRRQIFSKILLGIIATIIVNMNVVAMMPPAEAQLYTLFTYRGDTYIDTIRSDGSHLWSGGGDGFYVDSGAVDQSQSPFNGRPVYVPYLLDIQDDWVTFESGSITWTFDIPTCTYKLFEGGRIAGKSPVIESVSIIFQEKVGQNWVNLPHNDEECKVTVNELEDNTVQLIARQGTPQIGYTEIELRQKGGYDLESWYRSPYDTTGGKIYGFAESHVKSEDVNVNNSIFGLELESPQVFAKSSLKRSDYDIPIVTENQNGIMVYDTKDIIHNTFTDLTVKKFSPTKLQTIYDYHNALPVNQNQRLEIDPTYSSNNPTYDGTIKTSNNTGTSCPSPSLKEDNQVTAELAGSGVSSSCRRGFVEWDISSIDDSAIVSNTLFKFEIIFVTSPRNCDFNEINTQPSPASASTIWTDIGDGTTFVDNDSVCTSTGTNKSVDLGTSADDDVEAQLSSNWWAVGIKYDNETRDSNTHTTYIRPEEEPATPDPTLEITYTVPCTPNAPTSPTAESSSTSQIDLTWVAPTNCTNGTVEVQRSATGAWAGEQTTIYSSTPKTSHSDTGLSSNDDFFYRIRYQSDSSGGSLWGSYSSTVSDYTTPGQVTGLTATTQSTSQINLSWSAVSGGGTVTYDVEQRNGTQYADSCSGFTGWTVVSNNQPGLTYNSTSLDITTCYDYRLSATNSDSTGATSTKTGVTLPIEPRMFLGSTAFSTSQINLTWLPPSEGVGSFYKVYYRTQGGAWQVLTANTTSSSPEYNATSLSPNVIYDFKVATLGLGGESTNTTLIKSETTIPGSITLTTNGLSLSEILLSWTNPTGNGTITGYKIARESPIGGGWSFIVNNTGNTNTTYTDTGLASNTFYNYRMFALNEGNNDE